MCFTKKRLLMKFIRLSILITLSVFFLLQTSQVLAKHTSKGPLSSPVTNPITSPITSPLCKPGWGFGDKNHCHFGPPGHFDKDFGKVLTDEFDHYFKGFGSFFHFKF